MLSPEESERARAGIADTVASIDRGSLEATPRQRAYLEGAAAALEAGTADGSEHGDEPERDPS